jgi:hypothetical protein
MIRLLTIIIPILLLSACSAKLNVRIDTLNPDYVRARIAASNNIAACQRALVETPESIQEEIADLAQQLFDHHALVAKSYHCEATPLDAKQRAVIEALADEARISIAEAISDYALDDYRAARVQSMDSIQQIASGIPPDLSPCTSQQPELFVELSRRRSLINTNADKISGKLKALREHISEVQVRSCTATKTTDAEQAAPVAAVSAAEGTNADDQVAESQKAIDRRARSILGSNGATLSASPYAYLISSAPENEWQLNFNRAEGRGSMGNLDVAIILNETADFSVKGMRFDANKIAEVASKLTSQALHMAVQIAGGPAIGVAAPAGTQPSALTQSTAALAAAQQQMAVREALRQSRQRALYDLADTLIANYGLVDTSNLATTAASIRARLDAQLALLKLTPPTQP